jgi:hypothetical protein
MSKNYIKNPITGRLIKIDGPTYKKLSHTHDFSLTSSSRTRGWHDAAPRKGKERHELKKRCGNKCFLKPENEGFPICKKCSAVICDCKTDCRGVAAAKIRAHQYKHVEIYDIIDKLSNECKRK